MNGTRAVFAVALAAVVSVTKAEEFRLVEDGRSAADVIVEAKATYDLNASVADFLEHLERLTGVKFELVKTPKAGRKLIRIVNDPSLAEQEARVTIAADGVTLASSDHPEYAIYDFLREDCGVEWLDPTEAGTVFPKEKLVAVKCREGRDRPFCLARRNSGVFTTYDPLLWRANTPGWTNYLATAYPSAWAKGGIKAAIAAKNFGCTRFKRRMKAQGRNSTANHSFYWFNDRFLNRQSPTFIELHPEWFAKGYSAKEDANRNPEDVFSSWDPRKAPPQMCYSHPGLIRQTVEDVRAYFDVGGYTNRYTNMGVVCDAKNPAPFWGKDTYCLEPHDNEAFCRCEECSKQYRPERKADRGTHSDYWFRFVNAVAKEIKKSHPGRKISTLAYGSGREGLPSFPLEDNVVVHFCYSCNRMPNTVTKDRQEQLMRDWHAAYPKMHMGVWLYNCFPQDRARRGGWNVFPGFFGGELARQYRFLKELNADEIIFNCGMTDDFESYLTFRLMWKPDEDYETLKAKWFSAFGAAEKPVRAFYDLVEKRFCDRSVYPEKSGHQTRLMAWGYLGTTPVMEKLRGFMAEAERLADTPLAKARVANWKAGVWDYMSEGKWPTAEHPTGREGVRAVHGVVNGGEAPAFEGDVLKGRRCSATCKGVWFAIGGKGERYQLADLPVFTDGDLSTDAWMNGHPVTDLVVRVEGPVKKLTRLRVTTRFTDYFRSRAEFQPVGWKDGRIVELADVVHQTTPPDPNWKVTGPDTRCAQTFDWYFSPGHEPRDLDAVGVVDRNPNKARYTPPIAAIEAN